MLVQKLRLQRGWSQQQLADLSGLSVRTIQRIENGQSASVETMKSLAAVFEIDFSHLQAEPAMNIVNPDSATPDATGRAQSSTDPAAQAAANTKAANEEMLVLRRVAKIRRFYMHLIQYMVTMMFLWLLNLMTSPNYLWVMWPALGWGFGLLSHAISTFELSPFFGADWERREVERRLGRKL